MSVKRSKIGVVRGQQDSSYTSLALVIGLFWTSYAIFSAASAASTSHLVNLAKTRQFSTGSAVSAFSNSNKLIFGAPNAMQKLLNELVVTSRTLNLRKRYSSPSSMYSSSSLNQLKSKQNRKDSRIYYISMPPMPYRFIPGIGYDYQPVKIKPLLAATDQQPLQPQLQQQKTPSANSNPESALGFWTSDKNKENPQAAVLATNSLAETKPRPSISLTPSTEKDSKIYHLSPNGLGGYLFNGRPTRLQVFHEKKDNLLKGASNNKLNTSPKLIYFNKNIIF